MTGPEHPEARDVEEMVTPTLTLLQLIDQLTYLAERIEGDPQVIYSDGVLQARMTLADYDRETDRAVIVGEPL